MDLIGKFHRFSQDPIGTVATRLRWGAGIARSFERLLKQAGVYDEIKEFCSKRPPDSIPPVLARAARENGHGFVFSVDSSRDWLRSTLECMPRRAAGWYEISYSPVRVEVIGGTPTWRHEVIPDVTPNLVYLDGPPLSDEVQAASDLVFMEDRLPEDFYVIIDGRPLNYKFLHAHLKRRYRFEYSEEHFRSTIELSH
jgi:hypothetical protein